jgi:quinohemoprotein ethanol dehydrogenase
MTPPKHAAFKDIVLHGALRPLNMPQWDDVLSEQDADAIHAYLIAIAWDAYKSQSKDAVKVK